VPVEPSPTVALPLATPALSLGERDVRALLDLSRELAAARDEGQLAAAVTRGLEALLPRRAFCLRFLDPKSLALTSFRAYGALRPHVGERVALRRSALRATGLSEEALVARGLAVADYDEPVLEGTVVATAVPLAAGGQLLGVLHVEYAPGVLASPEADEPVLLQIANQAAITARNLRALEEVTYLKGFLEDLIENANALVLVADRGRRVLVWNRALRELTGRERDDALGKDLASLAVPEERARVAAALARAFEGDPVADLETRLARKGGGEARIVVNTSALYGASGEVEGMIAIGQDTTALWALQKTAERAQRLAELGQLAAGTVHELANPLTAVTVYSESLVAKFARDALAGPAELDKLRTIRDAGHRLLRFSRDLMAYARPAPERLEEVDLGDVCDQTARMCEPALRRARARLERRNAEVRVQGVKGSLLQVLVNLVTNAAQSFSAAGGTVGLEAGPSGDGALIRVVDDGPGMSPEVRARIFEPFFSTKSDGEGTGLGLSIAQRIVLRHGGTIQVESTPGQGTSFTVRLPRRPPV
jgi:PAS domain S-box-containing protein